MDQLRLEVLRSVLVAAALAVAACGRELPQDIYIDSSWSPEETAIIEASIVEWNELSRTHLKDPRPVLAYRGRFTDEFQSADFGDDFHVIYRIGRLDQVPEFLRDDPPGGYGSYGDMLIFTFNICEGCDEYYDNLRTVALHEIGHFLGLSHYEHRAGIMQPGNYDVKHLQAADVEEFCCVYECK